ncbi:Ubiquinol-cytochrome-c reductase complex assembly factor 1 [Sesamum angolense]|uniref:Ubiquinol-cytochrome-c reductase complex assembly factor 1 n=1 Tax=Sesamum angolense TaxID=2727404 RepID=A0AAE2C3P7_9LAMI|nr:Ubiquinol-cytochrome-c reductase complex assembly factor 1 [Sesamum angolense]
MLPRWSRVFGQISNLRRSTEFARRDLSVFGFRSYAKVAAAVEPNADCDANKPEVNLNKLFWSKPRSLALATDSPYRIEDPQYEGIKRFVLKLMLFYSKQSQFHPLGQCYLRPLFSLEKTFKTTFSLLVLHMWLCLRRLKEEGKEGVELGQYLYEIYNHDLELRVSKAGVNLLLSKWMKELEKIFYGNIVAYDAAIGKQDDLENVIWRNVFSDDGTSKPSDGALLPVQKFPRNCEIYNFPRIVFFLSIFLGNQVSCKVNGCEVGDIVQVLKALSYNNLPGNDKVYSSGSELSIVNSANQNLLYSKDLWLLCVDKETILSGNFMFMPLEDSGPDSPRK